jgi:hypothetical protein
MYHRESDVAGVNKLNLLFAALTKTLTSSLHFACSISGNIYVYQTDCTVSALATDSVSLVLFKTYFKFNTKFNSQHSEKFTASVFSYMAITRYLPILGDTANGKTFGAGIIL